MMSEKLTQTSTAELNVLPFALQFAEPIPTADLKEIEGQYNPTLQVWQSPGQLQTRFPVATFQERPPTICTIPTRISPKVTRGDRGPDD